jgi:uncharacterized protein YehS (DUF1456 family)
MLTNNDIYKKIKIALNLKSEHVMEIFNLGGMSVTRSFCKFIQKAEDNFEFKKLDDEVLESFLQGLIIYKRDLHK